MNFYNQLVSFITHQNHTRPAWQLTLLYFATLCFATAVLGIVHRAIFRYGSIIKQRVGKMANPKYALDMFTVSGDFLAEIIHEEMFGEEGNAYLKHGIALPSKFIRDKAPALVIDVGSNVGLYGLAMKTFCEEALEKSGSKCRIPSWITTATTTKSASSGEEEKQSSVRRRRSSSNDRRTASAARKSAVLRNTTSSAASQKNQQVEQHHNTSSTTTTLLPAIRVIGFEPIPETYECCRRNWDIAFKETNQAYPELASSVYQYGIGASNFTASFHYDATTSAAASMSMSENTKPFTGKWIEGIGAWLRDSGRYRLNRMRSFSDLLTAPIDTLKLGYGHLLGSRFLLIRLISFLFFLPCLVLMIIYRVTALPASKKLDCQIITLPEALRRANADDPNQSIAFLKIDVEGAEEDVCNGIDDVTWARVHQAVIEVHDTPDGRVKRICNLLKKQGFKSITVDDEPLELHKMANIRSIFATRG